MSGRLAADVQQCPADDPEPLGAIARAARLFFTFEEKGNVVSVTVKLGVVQARSRPGRTAINLARATRYVERAAIRGAALVVLPELYACGYLPNRAVWAVAEPDNGPTASWLTATAKRLGIHLGAGTAQTDGSDIFNVFLLAAPDGTIAGRAYKTNAEAYVFKRGRRERVIDTAIGRIGVGICADNQFTDHLKLMYEEGVDLILMPHAWPTPVKAAGPVKDSDITAQRNRMTELPRLYALSLGVPVVFANQIGPLQPLDGLLGHIMDPEIWRLCGQSRIVDSDGTLAGALDDKEGVLTATVSNDPTRKLYDPPQDYHGWLQPGSALTRGLIIPLDIATGRLSYSLSHQRRRQARAMLESHINTPATIT